MDLISNPVLSLERFKFISDGKQGMFKVTSKGLVILKQDKPKEQLIPFENIISVSPSTADHRSGWTALNGAFSVTPAEKMVSFNAIHELPAEGDVIQDPLETRLVIEHVVKDPSTNKWSRKCLRLKNDKSAVIARWNNVIGSQVQKLSSDRPKRLLIFINPFGGRKEAEKVFTKKMIPLLNICDVQYKTFRTEHAGHATEILLGMATTEFESFDGLVCVGGDGTLSEIFTGLLLRTSNQDGQIKRPNVRVGVVPAGSTDAVALSHHGTTDVETAIWHILLGDRRNVDVIEISSIRPDGKQVFEKFSLAMASYGYFGDLLKSSESCR